MRAASTNCNGERFMSAMRDAEGSGARDFVSRSMDQEIKECAAAVRQGLRAAEARSPWRRTIMKRLPSIREIAIKFAER